MTLIRNEMAHIYEKRHFLLKQNCRRRIQRCQINNLAIIHTARGRLRPIYHRVCALGRGSLRTAPDRSSNGDVSIARLLVSWKAI